ncbi:hypothetical protein F5Y03DRAFT_365970 [Xylaria venustula]|nr:hypothetical protein F5Y03DRAFT_365970 [Xylaria venustula]
MAWQPPQDPDRPHCPYMPGFVMQITEHEPPPPFGPNGYPRGTRRHPSEAWLKGTPQSQQVLENPPQDTQWRSSIPPRTAVLKIINSIAVGQDRDAQLVACQILIRGLEKPYTVTAKIYDSLYYSVCDTLVQSVPRDVANRADMNYSREAATYRHLQKTKHLQKPGFAPEYHGSWTFDLDLIWQGKQHKRSIRLILIEYLHGSSIQDLYTHKSREVRDALHYDEAYRLGVLAELADGVVKQYHAGVNQRDLAPRNVMLVPSPQGNTSQHSLPRVVLIDYNIAVVFEHTKYGRHRVQDLSFPLNPAQFFWANGFLEFYGWAPVEWYERSQGKQSYRKWLLAKFGGNNASHFAPIEKKLELDYW